MQSAQQAARHLRSSAHQRAVTTPDNYYSRGRFRGTLSGNTLTFSTAKARLFAYAEGAVMDAATPGETGTVATSADTNLVGAGGQTIGGHELEIFGLSLQIVPSCVSPEAAAKIWAESCVSIIYNGKEIGLQVGPPYFIPGQSSLFGLAQNRGAIPPIAGGNEGNASALYGFWSNGMPGYDNLMKIPEGLVWTSAGSTDSNMTIVIEQTRAVTVTVPSTEAAATGIRGWAQPTAADLAVDFMVKLHARVTRARSHNL
jgi:hypothetical protein